MAQFLKGKYRGFYQAGSSECVRDIFRFRQVKDGKLSMEVTRRDMESTFHRFWRYENSTMSLVPVDENEPRLGGKVQVKSFVVDFRTLTLAF